jgi:aquaporin Z
MQRKLAAELLGTYWLVFGGCGTAVIGGEHVGQVGWLGAAFAFGLTVLTMAYAIGHISGCHLNPAVTLGLVVGGRAPAKDLVPYAIAQTLGAILAAATLKFIVKDWAHVSEAGFASNGYGDPTPAIHFFPLSSAFVAEAVLTFFFLFIIMGATDARAPKGFAGIVIGLALTLIHLVGIAVTNLSVNPARSTGPAVFVGGWALQQLWLFWVAPLLGGAVGGLAYMVIGGEGQIAPKPTT